MAKIPEPIASFRTTITNKITSTATTILIDSVTDDDGVSMDGKILGFVIDKGKAEEEYILGTVDYANSQLISVTRGLSVSDGATSISANKSAHRKKASIEVSDHPYITLFTRVMNGTDGIDPSYRPKLSSDVNTTDDKQFVTAAQLNRAAMAGVTSSRVLVEATAGETVAAGNLIYFKSADGRWWKCDADTAATVDNVILGIAQGAGTAGNAITGGSLLWGVDSNQTGRTIGAIQYASNTAGGVSESVGTTEVTIGQGKSATEIYFYPRLNQQITEDQQDALAGSSGTPSATNKFVTANDASVWDGSKVYAATSTGTDAYAATITGAVLANGLTLRIKLDVANTGPATFNLNGGGALAIVNGLSTPLVTGDLAANEIIILVYNSTGTVWQVIKTPGALTAGITTPIVTNHAHKRTFLLATRVMNAADGAVTYAHGMGAIPNFVRATMMQGFSNGGNPMRTSVGVYDRVNNTQSCIYQDGTNEASNVNNAMIYFKQSGTGDETGAVTAIDATNLTITWTKSIGSALTGQILLEFEI